MSRRATLATSLIALHLSACGGHVDGSAPPADGAGSTDGESFDSASIDASTQADTNRERVDAALDAPPTSFCSGNGARMVVNELGATPVVAGKALPLSCCHGGVFTFVTQAFAHPIAVLWRAQVGLGTDVLPTTIDLAKPPEGWKVNVTVGCDPFVASCTPVDSYSADLAGSLTVSLDSAYQYDATLCLSLAENASSPHPVLHALQLYAPHVGLAY